MMKFVLGLLLLPAVCNASTDVNIVVSSVAYSGVCVGTGTVQLVDNYVGGVQISTSNFQNGVDNSTAGARIGIELQNQDAFSEWCGYNVSVSSLVAGVAQVAKNKQIGFRIRPGDARFVGMTTKNRYYCIADDAATNQCVWNHLEWVYKQ